MLDAGGASKIEGDEDAVVTFLKEMVAGHAVVVPGEQNRIRFFSVLLFTFG